MRTTFGNIGAELGMKVRVRTHPLYSRSKINWPTTKKIVIFMDARLLPIYEVLC